MFSLFKTDGFKIGVVVVIALAVVFFMVDFFVMETFNSIGELQERNRALNRKTTEILVKHRRVKMIMEQKVIKREVTITADYIESAAFNIQSETIKIIAANLVGYCDKHKVPIPIAVGLVETLSVFNPTLVKNINDRGLFQINTAAVSGSMDEGMPRKLHDIAFNTKLGVALLAKYLDEYPGSPRSALAKFAPSKRTDDTFVADATNNALNYIAFRDEQLRKHRKNVKASEVIKAAIAQLITEGKLKKKEN